MQRLQEKLFRKVALERLSSPEQLDQLMRVVPPLGWLALVPLLGLIIGAVLWGWFGSIATKAAGRCVLIGPAGLAELTSVANGRITEVLVRAGDSVSVDQVVARVASSGPADRTEPRQIIPITSPFAGKVVDLRIGLGSLVSPGSSLMTIERAGNDANAGLQAVIYVPASEGGKVRAGMTAEITPTTARRERHGFMLGEVTYVSDYPATAQSMLLLLHNESIVRELSGHSPVTEIRAALVRDGSISAYRWTSPAGASVPVKGGTLCTAEIVLQEERPAALVVPALKRTLGVD